MPTAFLSNPAASPNGPGIRTPNAVTPQPLVPGRQNSGHSGTQHGDARRRT